MNCITLDGDPRALASLRQMIDHVDDLHLQREFTKATEALYYLEEHGTDLLFLEVDLPELNGLELIGSLENPPLVIVVTTNRAYAIAAFEKHVVDFLVKPVALPRFLSAVHFAKKVYENRHAKKEAPELLFIKADGRWNKLNLSEVTYIQAMGDYVRIFTEKDNYMVNKTMKEMMEHLPEDQFARVHRSYIIHIDHIDNIKEHSIVIGRDVIPVSERYRTAFMRHLNLL